jgi:hypothetical protein
MVNYKLIFKFLYIFFYICLKNIEIELCNFIKQLKHGSLLRTGNDQRSKLLINISSIVNHEILKLKMLILHFRFIFCNKMCLWNSVNALIAIFIPAKVIHKMQSSYYGSRIYYLDQRVNINNFYFR